MFTRKLVCFFIILLLLVGHVPISEAATQKLPQVYGKFATVIDAKTGKVVYSKQARGKWYPASMTKLVTAMLLLDSVEKGAVLTASPQAVKQDVSNSIFLLKVGERMSRDEALKALLVMSSNDVATMIAEHIAGTEVKFSTLMNKKAKEIGVRDTNFVTASGLHHPKHYTTTYDMALIAREVLHHYPEIIKVMGLKSTTVKTSTRTVQLTNRAQFHKKPNVIAGKTGYTDAARNSLVEIVEKDGVTLIGVVMKSSREEQYKDLAAMTNYSFHLLENKTVVRAR
ncbi:D-alanyl-D-alanine carboxypeptidase family protein [Pseudoneobacillus sp. C159]